MRLYEWSNAMANEVPTGWKAWLWPLRSRKVATAVVTVVVAYGAKLGLDLDEQMVMNILAVGLAVILGTALEDAGAKAGGK